MTEAEMIIWNAKKVLEDENAIAVQKLQAERAAHPPETWTQADRMAAQAASDAAEIKRAQAASTAAGMLVSAGIPTSAIPQLGPAAVVAAVNNPHGKGSLMPLFLGAAGLVVLWKLLSK